MDIDKPNKLITFNATEQGVLPYLGSSRSLGKAPQIFDLLYYEARINDIRLGTLSSIPNTERTATETADIMRRLYHQAILKNMWKILLPEVEDGLIAEHEGSIPDIPEPLVSN